MNHRPLSTIVIIPAVLIAVVALSSPAAGQTSAAAAKPAAQAPKTVAAKTPAAKPAATKSKWLTPWGEPDIQGVWNDATSTPLERPNGVATSSLQSDDQADSFQDKLANDLSRDRRRRTRS